MGARGSISVLGSLEIQQSDDTRFAAERGLGADGLDVSARATRAFAWRRKVANPVALLRLVLAFCLGEWGLRSTATWSTAIGLADLSNDALLYRLRQCGEWFAARTGRRGLAERGHLARRRRVPDRRRAGLVSLAMAGELAVKRLKSLAGLKRPPGRHECPARPDVLAHLLMFLLLEPLIDALEDAPRWAEAA
jgi:hypothetical protein